MSASRLTPQQRRQRKKRITTIVVVVLLALVLLAFALSFLRDRITERFAEEEEIAIQSAQVTVGSIQTTVSGSGRLSDEESETISLPANLTLEKVYVNNNQSVEAGAILAAVNHPSLVAAMAQLQADLDALDEEISEAEGEEISDTIYAPVSGRVKAIYVYALADIASVMYKNGCLMLLSLDGYMQVQIPAGNLAVDEWVTVTSSEGAEYDGFVESVVGETATILVSDKYPRINDTMTVTKDGELLGTDTIYPHKSLSITGYSGTVTGIYVNRGDWVDAGDTLITLADTSYSANFDSLLKERQELEEQMQALIAIYSEGGLYAPINGKVEGLNPFAVYNAASDTETTLMTLRPNDTINLTIAVDESDILNLYEDQTAVVAVDSLEDEYFFATVTEVATTGTSGSSGVTTYDVTLSMERTDSMRSGMSAGASIAISGAAQAMLLPEEAVSRTSSTYYVFTAANEETGELSGRVEVTVGVTANGKIEILSGLSEGDTVYYIEEEEESRGWGSGEMGSRGGNFPSLGGASRG